jgi:hypothetical protein
MFEKRFRAKTNCHQMMTRAELRQKRCRHVTPGMARNRRSGSELLVGHFVQPAFRDQFEAEPLRCDPSDFFRPAAGRTRDGD